MAMEALVRHVWAATKCYRKGEVVTEKQVGDLRVVTIDAFPPKPEGARTIDVHFLEVGFTEAAPIPPREFYDMIMAAAREAIDNQHPYAIELEKLLGGLSYVHLGAWLGSQTVAFQYLALGEFYKLWKVLTPSNVFHLSGSDADALAEEGFVYQGSLKMPWGRDVR